jgi:hypothetical protein
MFSRPRGYATAKTQNLRLSSAPFMSGLPSARTQTLRSSILRTSHRWRDPPLERSFLSSEEIPDRENGEMQGVLGRTANFAVWRIAEKEPEFGSLQSGKFCHFPARSEQERKVCVLVGNQRDQLAKIAT